MNNEKNLICIYDSNRSEQRLKLQRLNTIPSRLHCAYTGFLKSIKCVHWHDNYAYFWKEKHVPMY